MMYLVLFFILFFFSSRRRHTRFDCDWSSDCSSDLMGMLFIMAFVGGLTFQIFINIGMALGITPVIGVPLPLMSAGLASLIATFIAIGFAISVQLRRFVN